MEWFYDNLTNTTPPAGMIAVERVYCLDFNNFGDAEWQRLTAICNELPERKPDSSDGCPWWFGSEHTSPPFLFASVEPSGWLVSGVLPADAWQAWDTQLQLATTKFPRFACG